MTAARARVPFTGLLHVLPLLQCFVLVRVAYAPLINYHIAVSEFEQTMYRI